MRLTPLDPVVDEERATVRARLDFAESERPPFVAWFAVPAEYAGGLDTSATPFVPLATLLAGRLRENLRIEGPVSERIVAGAEEAGGLFAEWWDYRRVRIRAPGASASAASATAVGVFYSRGVDTSATVVRSLHGEIPERVTHLVSGFDVEWTFSTEVQREIWAGNERGAAALGLPLVRFETNARDILRGLIGWPRCFGPAYIGGGLALGGTFGTLLTGATQPLHRPEPRGSRFDLDPLWSTESTAVRQDAYELNRAQRLAIVASEPAALGALKVCWSARGARNCGRCSKCLRTMTALAIAGKLDSDAPFDGELTAAAVRAAPVDRDVGALRSIAAACPPEMADLAAAWREKADAAERAAQSADRRRRARLRRQRARRLRRRLHRRAAATVRRFTRRA